jgi:hypothetical protein
LIDTVPLGVLIWIGTPVANALAVKPVAVPLAEVVPLAAVLLAAVLLAAVLLELWELPPHPASAAAAIVATVARLAAGSRLRLGVRGDEVTVEGPPGQISVGMSAAAKVGSTRLGKAERI